MKALYSVSSHGKSRGIGGRGVQCKIKVQRWFSKTAVHEQPGRGACPVTTQPVPLHARVCLYVYAGSSVLKRSRTVLVCECECMLMLVSVFKPSLANSCTNAAHSAIGDATR